MSEAGYGGWKPAILLARLRTGTMRLRVFLGVIAATLAASGAFSGLVGASTLSNSARQMNLAPVDLVAIASGAHESLMVGDVAAHRALITLTDDFSFMGPFGGKPSHAAQFTDARWAEIARFFRDGHDAEFELVQSYYSKDLAVLVATERAKVKVGGLPAQNWSLRVTLVFRREQGEWRLAHRHADPLVRAIPLHEAAKLADDGDEQETALWRGG